MPNPNLGTVAFTGNGQANSNVFRGEGLYTTLVCVPDQPGTCQVFFRHAGTGTEVARGTAVAGLANVENEFVITYPIAGAYDGVFLRYVNTNNTAGTARFSAGSAG